MLARALYSFVLSAFVGLGVLAGPAGASGTVLSVTVADHVHELSLDDLRTLRTLEVRTTTIWTDGTVEFTGVPLAALLDSVGASGQGVSAIALNDYAVDIPAEGIGPDYPIVAYLMGGQPFSARDKGPLWIIYPYDADPRYRSDEAYARSVWQLARLIVQP